MEDLFRQRYAELAMNKMKLNDPPDEPMAESESTGQCHSGRDAACMKCVHIKKPSPSTATTAAGASSIDFQHSVTAELAALRRSLEEVIEKHNAFVTSVSAPP